MSKSLSARPWVLSFMLFLTTMLCTQQLSWSHPLVRRDKTQRFRLMTWNVENLYDTIPSVDADDHEFLPSSPRAWNSHRYWSKQGKLARTIIAAGGIQPVDIIGLCEVENDSVIYDLCRRTRLARLGYQFVTTHSADLRGIDVALIYQPSSFALFAHSSHRVPHTGVSTRPTRDILLASGRLPRGDTLDVMVVHFPSRRGGLGQSEPFRLRAASLVAHLVDSLMPLRVRPQIIVMGDFNDEPHNRSIRQVLSPHLQSVAASARPYPMTSNQDVLGTHYYAHQWSRIDQFLLSRSLLFPTAPLRTTPQQCQIYAPPSLLERTANGENKPRRTYLGSHYHGGISDHLPLLLDLWY